MNNTTKRTTLAAIVLIFTAATLVAGTFTTTTGQSAYAYNKKDNGKGNDNGNTITIQKCKQAAIQSGFDNNQEQECENLICTHPGNNATCTEEGAVVTPKPTLTLTPTPEPTTGTLLVTKICTDCGPGVVMFSIQITGNNPQPSTFVLTQGSSQLVTLGPGTFTIVESNPAIDAATFSGNCTQVGSSVTATGTISAGQQLTCTITNHIT